MWSTCHIYNWGVSLFLFCLLIIIIKQYCPAPVQEEEEQARLKILEMRNIKAQFETIDGIDANSNSGDLNSKTDYRQKLVSFFESKDPSRVVAVDALLEEYTGKEDHLLVMLSEEYEKKDLKTQQLRTEVDAAIWATLVSNLCFLCLSTTTCYTTCTYWIRYLFLSQSIHILSLYIWCTLKQTTIRPNRRSWIFACLCR